MTRRITVKDVRDSVEILRERCLKMGMDTGRWELHEGSSTYGRAYRLYDDGKGVLGLSQGFLGLTATEAYRALEVMLGVLWAIQDHQNGDQKTAS